MQWQNNGGDKHMKDGFLVLGLCISVFCFGIATAIIILPSACETDEPPFFEPFASDEDMWANIMAAYPTYDTMTDLQKTTALRTWASQHMYVSGPVNVYNHNLFDNEHPYLIFNHFSAFHNGEAGVMCTGYAHALCVLYDYAGFPSLKYDYGGDGCSHSVTLVRIIDEDEPKIIVQDSYFDYYYAWPNGTAMSVYEVFAEVGAARYDNIVPVYDGAIDYLVAVPIDATDREVFGVEMVDEIDHDTVIYRYWYTPENYLTNPRYVAAKNAAYGEAASDLDLIVEKRLIIYFGSGKPSLQDNFSLLEGDTQ